MIPKVRLKGDNLARATKEPLIKSHEGATLAFRDEMREARRSEWLIPLRTPSDKADRPKSRVPTGFRRNAALASLRSSCLSYG